VLANKQDICGAQSAEALSAALALDALSRGGRHVHLASVSAVTGAGLLPSFEWLVADVASRLFLFE
jgi:ADP-ribosylation factor-like protein 2